VSFINQIRASKLESKMSDVKEKITEIVQSQPDDASYEEILRELAFEHMVQRGLKDVREGQVVSNMVMEQQIRS
jgi:ribosomal protein S3AE